MRSGSQIVITKERGKCRRSILFLPTLGFFRTNSPFKTSEKFDILCVTEKMKNLGWIFRMDRRWSLPFLRGRVGDNKLRYLLRKKSATDKRYGSTQTRFVDDAGQCPHQILWQKTSQDFLERSIIPIDWPAYSSEVQSNWACKGQYGRLHGIPSTEIIRGKQWSHDDLGMVVNTPWDEPCRLTKLFQSMSKRCESVLHDAGGPSKFQMYYGSPK